MWNNWLDAGRSIAEKAKEAAEGIEAQLNDSVGLTNTNTSSINSNLSDLNVFDDDEDDDGLDDSFTDHRVIVPKNNKANTTESSSNQSISHTILGSSFSPTLVPIPKKKVTIVETKKEMFDDDQNYDAQPNKEEKIEKLDQIHHIGKMDQIERMEEIDINDHGNPSGWEMDDEEIILDDENSLNKNVESVTEKKQVEGTTPQPIDQVTSENHPNETNQYEKESNTENLQIEPETQVIETEPTSIPTITDDSDFTPIQHEDDISPNLPDQGDTPQPENVAVNSESNLEEALSTESNNDIVIVKTDATHHETSPKNDDKITIDAQNKKIMNLQHQILTLKSALDAREIQLKSNSTQLAEIQNIHETEKESLLTIIADTKDEAKKKIQKAKERMEDMQARLKQASKQIEQSQKNQTDAKDKDLIIEELRREGEKLAKNEGKMNENMRKAQKDVKELNSIIEDYKEDKSKMQQAISSLKDKCDDLEKELNTTRKEKDRVVSLSKELALTKEESQHHEAKKLSLEQEIIEMKLSHQRYIKDLSLKNDKEKEKTNLQQQNIQREKEEFMTDIEKKLRTSEKEANMREDALRHELEELRKRWQDAVHRADVLSMDVQQSTAPLIRQLESTERTSRIRAAAWAEVEQKLRSDLEQIVIQNESLQTSISNLQSSSKKNERSLKAKESQVEALLTEKDNLADQVNRLEIELEKATAYANKMKEEWMTMERLNNESSTKIRNDMMKTVMDNEARYKDEIDELCKKLAQGNEERMELEEQIATLLESSSTLISSAKENGDKAVRNFTDQASILESTLGEFDNHISTNDNDGNNTDDINGIYKSVTPSTMSSSFVAMEHLSQNLRASKLELEAIRKQLSTSEEMREVLQEELAAARIASEKLPYFQQRVEELTVELREKQMDIDEMRENMMEVKEMYRAQLDHLLEEKVSDLPANENNDKEDKEENPKLSTDFTAATFDITYPDAL